MRDILIDFRDNMVSRGTISQNDILSLESMIGENIITDQKSINYFTQDSTQVGTQEVKTILDSKIESMDVTNSMTMKEFLENARSIVRREKDILNFITEHIGGLSQSVIDFFQDPKYKNMYVKSDNGAELVEAGNEHLYGLVMGYNDFFIKLKEVVGISDDDSESFINAVKNEGIEESDCQYEPVLNHLLNNVVEPLTFNLLLKIKDNLDDIISRLNQDIIYWKTKNNYEECSIYFQEDRINDPETKKLITKMNDDLNLYNKRTKSFIFVGLLLGLLNKK